MDRVEVRDAGEETVLVLPIDDGPGDRQVIYLPRYRVGELTFALFRYARRRRLVPTVLDFVREAVRRR